MNHQNGYRKLGKEASHRRAMLRNMATSMVTHERINTTLAKAKELRKVVEKLVTKGKAGDLNSRRVAGGYLKDKDATKKLFSDLATRFRDRNGGYTRILHTGIRGSDGAKMAAIEFVDYTLKPAK